MLKFYHAIKIFFTSNIIISIIVGVLSGMYSGITVSHYITFEAKKQDLLYELVMLEHYYYEASLSDIEGCHLKIRFLYSDLYNMIADNDAEKLWKKLEENVYLRSSEDGTESNAEAESPLHLPFIKLVVWKNILDDLSMDKISLFFPFVSKKDKSPVLKM